MPDIAYHRNLPHLHPQGHPLFITFRLADSIPAAILEKLKFDRGQATINTKAKSDVERNELEIQHFIRYDDWLDGHAAGPRWLEEEKISGIVADKIFELNNNRYSLIAYCIMSNHVHMLIEHRTMKEANHRGSSANYPATETLRLLKGSTARECNLVLGRNGHFWHQESYDHFIRDENELMRTIHYILNNPVKVGLVKEWKDWKFSYVNPAYGEW